MLALGCAAIVGGIIYAAYPAGHINLYDANLVRLAESNLQGYCAGETLWKTGGTEDADMTAGCRNARREQRPDEPNLSAVIPSFCQAIVDGGWGGTHADCTAIIVDNQFWPTYDGGLTNSWNRARKWPKPPLSQGSDTDGSRTGDRDGNTRPGYYPGIR